MPEDLSPLWISLKTAFVATVLAAFLGILVARWMMTYRGKTRGVDRWRSDLTFSAAAYSGGVSPAAAAGQKQPGGAVSGSAGVSIIFTWTAAVIAATVVAFPLMYKTVLGPLSRWI